MVRRIVTVAIVLAACVAAVVLTGASDENVGKTYKAEFDNAFGLAEGGDLRIGGVNAGQTTAFSLSDSEPIKAVVEFTISEPGFDSLREDARCEVRQQSLIGEYFVDCQPGTSDQELPEGATIPVTQTASTIPADLVNNILREPYRERLRLIIAELGTGLAGRPEDLAEVIKRAHPGLRETNEVLEILGNQTDVIRAFVEDSDDVIDDLAANRDDVVRFVEEAGETAAITATRREELARQFERLPTFLAELDPTMVRLGELADAQIPLLADLRRASDELNTFFTRLGPFAQASRPAIRTLGDTSVVGRRALNESANEIRELERVARGAGKLGEPLRQFLQALDDRDRAITTDDRAALTDPPAFDRESLDNPRNRDIRVARGFTGFEAFMNFAFWQTLTTNSFDGVSHFLRILGVVDEPGCSPYGTGQPDRERIERCNSYLGPNQPGVENATGTVNTGPNDGPPKPLNGTEPDFTADDRPSAGGASAQSRGDGRRSARAESTGEGGASGPKGESTSPGALDPGGDLPSSVQSAIDRARSGAGNGGRAQSGNGAKKAAGKAGRQADEAAPDVTGGGAQAQGGSGGASSEQLLNFLLGP